MNKTLSRVFCAMSLLSGIAAVHAAVTPEEAAKLKSELTPFGGEKAGNKEGTIPAWTGGWTTPNAPGYKSGDRRPDPFASEKPLFSINAGNMDRYADKLSDGQKALFKKFPKSYRMDIYPTHRTASAPQWVYDNVFRNATRAKLTDNGLKLTGAYGGIPFPIPKTGQELIWNHLLKWQGEASFLDFNVWVVPADGQPQLATRSANDTDFPYYYKNKESTWNGGTWYISNLTLEPPFRAGEQIMLRDSADMVAGRASWQYLAGQRRVRRAPTVGYDTPNNVTSGTTSYDEIWLFNGPIDRYNFKLVGKQEMYVPYNSNRTLIPKDLDVVKPNHLNPDFMRWELHRVWVVDATLAEGKRHVVPKRRFYIDEDTSIILMADGWDAKGQLWKHGFLCLNIIPELPALVPMPEAFYDLISGSYAVDQLMGEKGVQFRVVAPRPDSFFTPEALGARGQR